jgi:predicted Zn-dependent protease
MRSIGLALLLCLLFASCATTSLPPVTQEFGSEEDEKRLWLRFEEVEEKIQTSGLIYRDEALEDYMNNIAQKLQPPETLKHISFRVKILKCHLPNASSFPTGLILIDTGALSRLENEAQLATILGHEMIHTMHRHALKKFRDAKNKSAFLATVTYGTAGLGSIVGALGALTTVMGYSRELETEADTGGLKLMVRAGYDPGEAPKFYLYMRREYEEEKIKEELFFGTHPRFQERAENYENLLKTEYKDKRGGIQNPEIFMEKIHQVILDNASLDLKAGRFKIAEKGVEKYLNIRSSDPKAYYLSGEIYRQKAEKGDLGKAKEYYLKAISLDPSYPEAHRGMGFIYFKQGDKELAKKSLEQYLSLSPQATDRAYIEEYIKECREGEKP